MFAIRHAARQAQMLIDTWGWETRIQMRAAFLDPDLEAMMNEIVALQQRAESAEAAHPIVTVEDDEDWYAAITEAGEAPLVARGLL